MVSAAPMAEAVFQAATAVADLLSTSERQDLYIKRWESLWKEEIPRTAMECANLAASLEGLERDLTPEEAEEMGAVLAKTGDMLQKVATLETPNPDLIALYYLRKIWNRMEEQNGVSF